MNELNLVLTTEKIIAENEMYELIACDPISELKKLSDKALKSESFKNSVTQAKAEKDKGDDNEEMYQKYKAQADEYFAAEQYDKAEEAYTEAAKYKPSPFLKGRINECKKRIS